MIKLNLSLTAGDNGADSVFSEPMGLNLNHDSGPANPNDLFGDTMDSGVGRSPRAPGSGSDPRSLGESSVPPAWLQDVSVCIPCYAHKREPLKKVNCFLGRVILPFNRW